MKERVEMERSRFRTMLMVARSKGGRPPMRVTISRIRLWKTRVSGTRGGWRADMNKRRFIRSVQRSAQDKWGDERFGPSSSYLAGWYEDYVAEHDAAPTSRDFWCWNKRMAFGGQMEAEA